MPKNERTLKPNTMNSISKQGMLITFCPSEGLEGTTTFLENVCFGKWKLVFTEGVCYCSWSTNQPQKSLENANRKAR